MAASKVLGEETVQVQAPGVGNDGTDVSGDTPPTTIKSTENV